MLQNVKLIQNDCHSHNMISQFAETNQIVKLINYNSETAFAD